MTVGIAWEQLSSQAGEDSLRRLINETPEHFYGDVARRNLHWFDEKADQWICFNLASQTWAGYAAYSGEPVASEQGVDRELWTTVLDSSRSPYLKWFVGAQTNACFNLLDRHVLQGQGSHKALIFEGDRWDPAKNAGRGGPVTEQHFTYRQLLLEVTLRARVLTNLGLRTGDRIALNMPNIPEQIFYILAAQRLGILYTPVFGGFSAKTLSDRLHDAGAKLVITADGGFRNAEAVPFKSQYTDPALDNYVPREAGLQALIDTLHNTPDIAESDQIIAAVSAAVASEITLERADIMRELGAALSACSQLNPETSAKLRTQVAIALAGVGHAIDKVIVARYTGQEVIEYERDVYSDDLVAQAASDCLEDLGVADFDSLNGLEDAKYWSVINGLQPVVAVEANWPLFIIYTSGSTGKPKGVVHTHGAWLAGVTHSMHAVFNATPDDTLYVVGDPGWITGQSYLIAAPLSMGMTTVVCEGSPLFPHAGRFASTIERHGVTLFKAGSTFLKAVMTDPASTRDMSGYDMSSLRAGTFCAEPVSPAVQEFAMEHICSHYINSYWATEHGGIVFSCPAGGYKDLKPDAKTWALPWIQAEVRVAEATGDDGQATSWRVADVGEKGELVITSPYPYLAHTLWGDKENFGSPQWCGDLERFKAVYFNRWDTGYSYTQGDYARQHPDAGFTLHGRSDDVINVSGHRIGTEEIEGAILRDKTLREDSPLGNVVVVGAPHDEKGETPVAFLVAAPGRKLTDDDFARLQGLVRSEKGATAVPSDFLVVPAFPETRSGKYMRRTLRSLLLDAPLGDLSTLKNPEVVDVIRESVVQWRDHGALAQARQIVQTWRYIRLEVHRLTESRTVALLFINNPPVNALNERALDELHTVIHQIKHQDHIDALVITGNKNTFVAGADVKELLKIGEVGDRESALTPPHAAQAAFSAIENLSIPVVAAINGPALGGGNELLLSCAYVIAADHATFGQPEVNLNLLPGYGGTQRLTRKLYQRRGFDGAADALGIMLRGRPIDADDAAAMGLVDEVVPSGAESAVDRAMARLRAHFSGEAEQSPLTAILTDHAALLEARELPLTLESGLEEHPQVATALRQLTAGGRSHVADRIVEATQIGIEQGVSAGLDAESRLFADAVCDPASGPTGILAFLEKRSAPLPCQPRKVPAYPDEGLENTLLESGELLPVGTSFYPGVTPVPSYQYGWGVARSQETGAPEHGDPAVAEKRLVFPTPSPGAAEALVYVLASEVNFNDIWAVTGIPVSPFDARETDVQVTGSGGVGLVVQLGADLVSEGRLAVGDVVTIYSGQSELLSPDQGLDPMAADFRIQGYERNDGSHGQFLAVQGPQLHPKLASMTFEEAGSYGLTMGTIQRALFTTLDIEPGKRLFVEGASTGTGYDCLRSATASGLSCLGMVSSTDRASRVEAAGGQAINRKDDRWQHIFTAIPDDPSTWQAWHDEGVPFVKEAEATVGGRIDYAVSHAGENAFPAPSKCWGTTASWPFTAPPPAIVLLSWVNLAAQPPRRCFNAPGYGPVKPY
jgi:acrylyl-CoA reductase (NADPH)/3-hydroxypropionyl-CoA dehydratase/3-hydroxypropionyl-CoA synthetase